MKEGYQIIEIDYLDDLILGDNDYDLILSILLWLISCLEGYDKELIIIEIIKVEYLGNYPAIGIKYLEDYPVDIEPFFQKQLKKIIKEKKFIDYLSFCKKNFSKINKIKRDLNGNG